MKFKIYIYVYIQFYFSHLVNRYLFVVQVGSRYLVQLGHLLHGQKTAFQKEFINSWTRNKCGTRGYFSSDELGQPQPVFVVFTSLRLQQVQLWKPWENRGLRSMLQVLCPMFQIPPNQQRMHLLRLHPNPRFGLTIRRAWTCIPNSLVWSGMVLGIHQKGRKPHPRSQANRERMHSQLWGPRIKIMQQPVQPIPSASEPSAESTEPSKAAEVDRTKASQVEPQTNMRMEPT